MLHGVAELLKEFAKRKTGDQNEKEGDHTNRLRGDRFLFVGGAPRSGTTLLQHVLDSHPLVFGGPEFDCIPGIIHIWRQIVAAWDRGRIRVFGARPQIDAAFASLIEALLLPAADAHQVRVLSEKTPFNVLVFSDLLELFPGCRVLHLVRDPRAVVSSMLQVGVRCLARGEPAPGFVLDLESALCFTRECLDAGFQACAQFPERALTLIYERFVSHPREAVEQLCSFLQLPFAPRCWRRKRSRHPRRTSW